MRYAPLIGVLVIVGCFPQVTVTPLTRTTFAEVSDTTIVPVLETDKPDCPFREVAAITATDGGRFTREEIRAAIIVQARRLGANGIIRFAVYSSPARSGPNGMPVGELTNYSGIAVLFTQRGCTR